MEEAHNKLNQMLMLKCQNLVRIICILKSLHPNSKELPVALVVDQATAIRVKNTFTKEITAHSSNNYYSWMFWWVKDWTKLKQWLKFKPRWVSRIKVDLKLTKKVELELVPQPSTTIQLDPWWKSHFPQEIGITLEIEVWLLHRTPKTMLDFLGIT